MGKIKARYAGRLQGLIDGLGCRYSRLTPDDYFSWYSEKERQDIAMRAIKEANCSDVINRLVNLTKTADSPNSFYTGRSEEEENLSEYKLGLREGQMAAKNGNYSSLTLP